MALASIGFVGVLTVDDYARNAVKDIFNGLVLILAGLSLAALGIMKVLTGIGNFNGTAIERHQPAYARTWKNDCDKRPYMVPYILNLQNIGWLSQLEVGFAVHSLPKRS